MILPSSGDAGRLSTKSAETEPRRVAYILDTSEFGGMEVLQLEMLKHLDTRRYLPFLLSAGCLEKDGASPAQFLSALKVRGIELLQPPPTKEGSIGALRKIANLAQLLRTARIDIAHIQTNTPLAARKATIAARLGGVHRLVRTEHLPPSRSAPDLRRYHAWLVDFLTDHFVTDSLADREEQIRLVGRRADRITCSYCGIDPTSFVAAADKATAKAKVGLRPDLPVVGAIGRLTPQKGHSYLVDAVPRILQSFSAVQFLLVGDGELRRELEGQVDRLGVRASFTFAGFQSDYVSFMQAMDIGVMPSLFEGFSISMQEFMALAMPLVVTDHVSFREAITHNVHGLMVPVRDSEAIASAVLRLLTDPALAAHLGRSAQARVRSDFTIQKHMQDLMGLYDKLLGNRPALGARN